MRAAVAILLVLYLSSFIAPFIAPHNPKHQYRDSVYSPPGKEFPLGTDGLGRDVLSRLLYGGRISLTAGVVGALISYSLGLIVGSISGYFRGLIDTIIMRLCEVLMSVPTFFLLVALSAVIPPDISSAGSYIFVISILSLIGWAGFARVIRGMASAITSSDFVQAAKSLGESSFKILIKHVVPNTLSYTLTSIALSIPSYIIAESALSMLGLGIREPEPSWGNMLRAAMNIHVLTEYPWMLTPALLIMLTVICFNVLADELSKRARKEALK